VCQEVHYCRFSRQSRKGGHPHGKVGKVQEMESIQGKVRENVMCYRV